MFTVTKEDIALILNDFGIFSDVITFSELQRYNYEKNNPASKDVRLIIKANLNNGQSVVVRFKNESGVTLKVINDQSRFAKSLADNGIKTPALFMANHEYARWYTINRYDVIVTVEEFVTGEIHAVSEKIAEKTGKLLAQMHNMAEAGKFHVQNSVLFDPLSKNELFSFQDFQKQKDCLLSVDEPLYNDIVKEYDNLYQKIRVFENEPRYAVQGDISNCNLYQTADGEVGVFDFNRCGDNVLYYDAIMQAIFESRLMDYSKEIDGNQEGVILPAFLRGYHRERPFTDKQKEVFPYLYAIISAFWLGSIRFDEDSLCYAIEAGDTESVHKWMKKIHRRTVFRPEMTL
ncbi:MAG: phosphotransferase [Lachnospiraceae bacterium]|nr:phosphotransferase [Lachnospiraceae bacterium]